MNLMPLQPDPNCPEAVYFLNAAPISLAGSDGAPCRAILIGKEQLSSAGS